MSTHVLLNLLNEFDKFNNTRARILDLFYHMTLILLRNLISAVETLSFCQYVRQCCDKLS